MPQVLRHDAHIDGRESAASELLVPFRALLQGDELHRACLLGLKRRGGAQFAEAGESLGPPRRGRGWGAGRAPRASGNLQPAGGCCPRWRRRRAAAASGGGRRRQAVWRPRLPRWVAPRTSCASGATARPWVRRGQLVEELWCCTRPRRGSHAGAPGAAEREARGARDEGIAWCCSAAPPMRPARSLRAPSAPLTPFMCVHPSLVRQSL